MLIDPPLCLFSQIFAQGFVFDVCDANIFSIWLFAFTGGICVFRRVKSCHPSKSRFHKKCTKFSITVGTLGLLFSQ